MLNLGEAGRYDNSIVLAKTVQLPQRAASTLKLEQPLARPITNSAALDGLRPFTFHPPHHTTTIVSFARTFSCRPLPTMVYTSGHHSGILGCTVTLKSGVTIDVGSILHCSAVHKPMRIAAAAAISGRSGLSMFWLIQIDPNQWAMGKLFNRTV